ncbi:MAG TPA: hypothetical protein VGP70_00830 [Actinomadura sp.]|nr:hypothetical protein [Actinomadura sp.]
MTGTDRLELARAVARAAATVPGVTRVVGDAGPVEVATLGPKTKVPGVRITDRSVEVHIAVDALPVHEVAAAVARAVRGVLTTAGDDRDVVVVVEDLDGVDALPEPGSARGTSR